MSETHDVAAGGGGFLVCNYSDTKGSRRACPEKSRGAQDAPFGCAQGMLVEGTSIRHFASCFDRAHHERFNEINRSSTSVAILVI